MVSIRSRPSAPNLSPSGDMDGIPTVLAEAGAPAEHAFETERFSSSSKGE